MAKRKSEQSGHERAVSAVSNERLNRYIARSGVTSRRKADDLISAGRVSVNGTVVTELGTRISKGDVVEVNGRRISPRDHHYILLNKPNDVVTTTDDEKGRKTVLDLVDLPEARDKVIYPVGRLDRETVGVLLLTNDGELANRLMHPRYEIEKLYVVRTKEKVRPHELEQLKSGVELDDGPARADYVAYADPNDERNIGISLHEGRNRQVRRMVEAIGHEVERLERVNYAGLTTEGVRRGKWRRLEDYEIRRLRRQVKLK